MTQALRPYPEYKDSGVEWLGEVPAHWEVQRLKQWLELNRSTLPEDTDPSHTFAYLDIGSVGTGYLAAQAQRIQFGKSPSRARRIAKAGDTIISTVRTYLKAVWHVDADIIASTGFAVLTPKRHTDSRHVSYWCQSKPFTDWITANSVGIAYPAIAEAKLAAIEVAVPTPPEQAAIARYLDHVTESIDRYIRSRQRLIELLGEQKQVLIDEAVTGRIDVRTGKPYPEYKDSGVEWLGEVPTHWEILPSRSTLFEVNNCGHPKQQMLSVTISEGVIRQKELLEDSSKKDVSRRDKSAYKLVEPNDVAYNKMRAWQGAIGVSKHKGIVSPAYVVQRPRDTAHSRYLHHLLRAPAFACEAQRWSYGIASDMWNLRPEHFKLIYLCLPPSPEQTSINRHINEESVRINDSVANAQRQIELLREYRTRLIADVVTGKLDVRQAAAGLPQNRQPPVAEPADSIRDLASAGQAGME